MQVLTDESGVEVGNEGGKNLLKYKDAGRKKTSAAPPLLKSSVDVPLRVSIDDGGCILACSPRTYTLTSRQLFKHTSRVGAHSASRPLGSR